MTDGAGCDWLHSTVLEAPAPFACRSDQVLGGGLPPATRAAFAPSARTAEVRLWRMRDVTYLHNPGRAYRGGEAVAPTCRGVSDIDPARVRAALAGPHARLGGARVFCGTNRFNSNYFHLVADIIPAIAAYAADPGFADGLLLGPNARNVAMLRAGLALAGVASPPLLPVCPLPRDIADLTYCSLLNGSREPALFARSVYDRMVATACDGGSASPAQTGLIYVWRADAAGRPMRNEDTLVERLAALGVTPVLLSALTLAEQIRLFHAARLVIGPHGAGLANVVFARAGAVLYELLPSHYTEPCFAALAQLRGLHYWCDVYPAETRPGLWRTDTPWSVDIEEVLARVAAIVAMYRLG